MDSFKSNCVYVWGGYLYMMLTLQTPIFFICDFFEVLKVDPRA